MTRNSLSYNRTLFLEDNLPVLRGLDSKSIDLIATDPPFNKGVGAFEGTTKAGVNIEFKDVWHWDDVQDEWLDEIKDEHSRLFQHGSLRERVGGERHGSVHLLAGSAGIGDAAGVEADR